MEMAGLQETLGFVQAQRIAVAAMVTDRHGYGILYLTQVAVFHHMHVY